MKRLIILRYVTRISLVLVTPNQSKRMEIPATSSVEVRRVPPSVYSIACETCRCSDTHVAVGSVSPLSYLDTVTVLCCAAARAVKRNVSASQPPKGLLRITTGQAERRAFVFRAPAFQCLAFPTCANLDLFSFLVF